MVSNDLGFHIEIARKYAHCVYLPLLVATSYIALSSSLKFMLCNMFYPMLQMIKNDYDSTTMQDYRQQLIKSGHASCYLCEISFLSLSGILQHIKTCCGYAKYVFFTFFGDIVWIRFSWLFNAAGFA